MSEHSKPTPKGRPLIMRYAGSPYLVEFEVERGFCGPQENVDIRYTLIGATRAMSKSCSTRIAEVENAGKPDERELPVGNDHGYLWRLYSYWRIEEKDGGVYIQVESIALSRTIPWEIAWLVNPLVRSIPSTVLFRLLDSTRRAVQSRAEHRALFHPGPC